MSSRPRGGDWLDDEVAGWKDAGVGVKVALYLNQGVKEVWLLHPKKQTVELMRERGRSFASGSLVLPEALVASIEVALFFLLGGVDLG